MALLVDIGNYCLQTNCCYCPNSKPKHDSDNHAIDTIPLEIGQAVPTTARHCIY